MSKISNPNINVICRFRPMNELEKTNGNEMVATFTSNRSLTFKSSRENNKYNFNFDRIFPPTTTQEEVYNNVVSEIIDSVLDGYNGTVLAYGQTSSGKTHTMQGIIGDPINMGIIPRMIEHVFNYMYGAGDEFEFSVKVSMIEIYQEKIRDLIDTSRVDLNIKEDKKNGIYVNNVSEHYVGRPEEVLEIMKMGSDNRAQAATNMNEHSSRSHSIFILIFNSNNKREGVSKTGKLYLVDLAGSEKISKTGATGTTLEEAKIINKSLTTLGMVINALTDGKSIHIPYRESKLTRVLQESLGGNSKTCLIITCSPSIYNESETLSTLRFGERAKKIKNKPKINKEYTVDELQKIIEDLTSKLEKANQRIKQLEDFIRKNGLKVPTQYGSSNTTNQKKGENNILTEEDNKIIMDLKSKFDNETIEVGDKLQNAIGIIGGGIGYDDLKMREIIAMLLSIKDKINDREIENQEKIKELNDELEGIKNIRAQLKNEIINNNTADAVSQGDPAKKAFSLLKLDFNDFLGKLKNEAAKNKNDNVIQMISQFQKNITDDKYSIVDENDSKQNDSKPNQLNKNLQKELDDLKKRYNSDINIYKETIDQKIDELTNAKSEYENLKNEFECYKEANKLKDGINDYLKNMKAINQKNIILSQEKSNFEVICKSLKEKVLNYENIITELREQLDKKLQQVNLRATLGAPIVKKIQGGNKGNPSMVRNSLLGNFYS